MDLNTYALGEIYHALRAGLTFKGQAAADDALLQAATRTEGQLGNALRIIAGADPVSGSTLRLVK
jgi:hypothetical protein